LSRRIVELALSAAAIGVIPYSTACKSGSRRGKGVANAGVHCASRATGSGKTPVPLAAALRIGIKGASTDWCNGERENSSQNDACD
jgi:hypothetical protein